MPYDGSLQAFRADSSPKVKAISMPWSGSPGQPFLQGALVHDARIAALYLFHGVRALWSADRDFSRFPELTVINPLPTG